ncbi:MAG: TldD/PmbA family protein [Nitrososphaerales archaeon]
MDTEVTASEVLDHLVRLGAEDASVIVAQIWERMLRFNNNALSVTKSIKDVVVFVYASIGRRRIIGSTSNPTQNALKDFVFRLIESCKMLEPNPHYTHLPKGPFSYPTHGNYDPKIESCEESLLEDYAKQIIDQAIQKGGKRTAGTITAEASKLSIVSTGGVRQSDRSTRILLNQRVFIDDASGHGLACSTHLNTFNPLKAAEEAAQYAKKAVNRGPWSEGVYDIVISPTVAADLIQHVGEAASAFAVESGISFLADKLNEQVACDLFTLIDHGVVEGSLNTRIFDDEGVPTRDNVIIENGVLKTYLHNSSTAERFKAASTGSAGIIAPHPWNLEVNAGSRSLDELLKEVGEGFYITNNWYTRFQNLRSGEYSTLPRDAAFYIKSGEVKHAVAGLRISDSLPRQLKNIAATTEERRWIYWWEVQTPTLTPYMLIKQTKVTKAVG